MVFAKAEEKKMATVQVTIDVPAPVAKAISGKKVEVTGFEVNENSNSGDGSFRLIARFK